MYEVHIDADPLQFLDLDVPLGEQAQHIREAAGVSPAGDPFSAYAQGGGDLSFSPTELGSAIVGAPFPGGASAQSRALLSKGIPGIRYSDTGSRGAGEGSRNYVVFDDRIITILKKYGWAPGAAIPAAAMGEILNMQGQSNQPEEVKS